jgi:hypothetical protein
VKIRLLSDWTGLDRIEGVPRLHKAGDTVSVYHFAGHKLINRRLAKWICTEDGDPQWVPAEPYRLKAAVPEHNRMITGGVNK